LTINIKNILKKIEKDWEKFIFGGMLCLAFFLLIAFFISLFFYNDPTHELNVTGSSQQSIFGENAFAFLYGVPLLEDDETPFNLKKSFPKQKRKKKKKKPRITKLKPKAKPVKQGYVVFYNGWITVATGEKLAFMKIHDLRSKKLLKSGTALIGGSIHNFTIKEIDDTKVVFEDQNGDTKTVPIHKQITILKK
jgi:hypothetical protein